MKKITKLTQGGLIYVDVMVATIMLALLGSILMVTLSQSLFHFHKTMEKGVALALAADAIEEGKRKSLARISLENKEEEQGSYTVCHKVEALTVDEVSLKKYSVEVKYGEEELCVLTTYLP